MSAYTYQQSMVTLPSLEPIQEMVARATAQDGYPAKLYWYSLKERLREAQALDYLCFHEGQVVGMLNILFFNDDAAEFTVVIDPQHRQQGIFRKLLKIALMKLHNYAIDHYQLITHHLDEIWPQKLQNKGGIADHQEIEMLGPKTFTLRLEQPLRLRQATAEDIDLMASIHVSSFKSPSAEAIKRRFSSTIHEPSRQVWLAYNAANVAVGKLHLREDYQRMLIHDFSIDAAYQGQGYGQALMTAWYQQYSPNYAKPITVEVLGDNLAAIKLYEKCGFQLEHRYQFWRFNFR